jgi:hypothetical protein
MFHVAAIAVKKQSRWAARGKDDPMASCAMQKKNPAALGARQGSFDRIR